MNKNVRIIATVAALLLILVYFFPIWQIYITAPQYPEGIGMYIWVNQITGMEPNNLQSINILNHYIGMKNIEPDAVPELKLMPYITGFLIFFGLLTAMLGKRKLLIVWLALFIIVSIVGIGDFYIWLYDYGHDLNPDAAIKVPGASYQPPLFGSKTMLNITASSFPHIGGYIYIASILLCFAAVYLDFRCSKKGGRSAEK
jgi:copper chaperone NosL